MTLNSYFNNYNHPYSQSMVENLIIESIKMFGLSTYYIPRTVNNLDKLIGEDNISSFEKAAELEMYLKDAQGVSTNPALLSKFGIELTEDITFVFSIKRFDEIRTQKLENEDGYTLQNESANLKSPLTTDAYEMEDGNANDFSITWERPRIGDLIYIPLSKKWYEIKFVKTFAVNYYQLGKLQMYEVDVSLFEYSNETFNTGITEIDAINDYSTDFYNLSYENEDGTTLLNEDGVPLTIETFEVTTNDPIADNINIKIAADQVIDWSEISPFVKTNEEQRW